MKKTTLLLIIALFSLISYGQVKNDIKVLQQDIETLKLQNKNLQNEIFDLQKSKNTTSQLEEKSKIIAETVKIAKNREDRFLNRIEIGLLLFSSLLALLSFIGFTTLRKMITNLIADKVNTLKDSNLDTIKRLFSEEKWRMDLMKKSNIIVVNPNTEGDDENLPAVLQYFLTQKVKVNFDSDNIIKKITEKKHSSKLNIVLLEDSGENWIKKSEFKEQAIKLVSNIPDDCFIMYYGGYGFPNNVSDYVSYPNAKEIVTRLSFVNAPSKLYSNLVDTLKYMDIINPNLNA